MKKILLGSVATGALIAAGSANAADLGVRPAYKAAPMVAPPAPVFSWTGCHVGAHVGWGWGRHDVTNTFVSVSTGGDEPAVQPFSGSGRIDSSGAIFGGQIGCDYQFWGSWVIGVEGAASAADINGFGQDPLGPIIGSNSNVVRVKTDSLGSVTGRLGFTGWLPQTMIYVRGGWAYSHERWDLSQGYNTFGDFFPKVSRSGWTVGAGVEWAFAPNWSAFVEYDHYDFGSKNIASFTSYSGCDGGNLCFSESQSLDAKTRIEAVKIGLNWRFDGLWFGKGKGPAPVQARY